MKKPINREEVDGRIYDHSLELKVTGPKAKTPGVEYISGNIDVATDDAGLNIVTVHFSYVTATTSKGTANKTYTALKNIIENAKTVLNDGIENATMVKISTALGLNDFYTSRNGEETLVSAKRNESGFVTIVTKLDDEATRNKFEFDMIIYGTRKVEADEERHIDADYLVVQGAIFDFKNAILPVELVVKNQGGINYFESLEASKKNIIFTKVWGNIESQTIIDKREEESAFGEAAVKEYTRTIKEWVITGTAKEPYPTDDADAGITAEEIKQALENREVHLAEVKKNAEEYQAQKNAGTAPSAAGASAQVGGFNF